MGWTIGNTSTRESAATEYETTVAHTHNGVHLVVLIYAGATFFGNVPDYTSVKWNGTALTKVVSKLASFADQGCYHRASIWVLANAETGSYNLVLSGGGYQDAQVLVLSLSGGNTTDLVEDSDSYTDYTTNAIIPSMDCATGGIAFAVFGHDDNSGGWTFTEQDGATEIDEWYVRGGDTRSACQVQFTYEEVDAATTMRSTLGINQRVVAVGITLNAQADLVLDSIDAAGVAMSASAGTFAMAMTPASPVLALGASLGTVNMVISGLKAAVAWATKLGSAWIGWPMIARAPEYHMVAEEQAYQMEAASQEEHMIAPTPSERQR